jgi:hypothetical protein
MKITRAIFAAALMTRLLTVAAYSQETRASADAFLYIIWPPDGTTVKAHFGSGLAFATWALPRRAVMPQTAVSSSADRRK